MTNRVYNFSAGPAMLPLPVLEASAKALVDFQGKGVGIAEVSHRGKEFDGVLDETIARCKKLMAIPDTHDVIFLQGGATQLFTTIPMNFLQGSADYVVTGEWAKKAAEAAKPYGTRWSTIPEHRNLIADVSSEFMGRVMDVSKYAMLYGGAQKNLGPSGVVLAIVRKDLYDRIPKTVPGIFSFKKHAEAKSCLNTPPTFGIYILMETLRWIEAEGGIAAIEARNEAKAKLIYDAIDSMSAFYKGTVTDIPNRSRMNITFRLPSEELTDQFIKEAEKLKMVALKGYRTVGGIRASVYNAMPLAGCQALADHMTAFAKKHG